MDSDAWALAAVAVGGLAILFLPLGINSCKNSEVEMAKVQLEEKKVELKLEMIKAGITNDVEGATSPASDKESNAESM